MTIINSCSSGDCAEHCVMSENSTSVDGVRVRVSACDEMMRGACLPAIGHFFRASFSLDKYVCNCLTA